MVLLQVSWTWENLKNGCGENGLEGIWSHHLWVTTIPSRGDIKPQKSQWGLAVTPQGRMVPDWFFHPPVLRSPWKGPSQPCSAPGCIPGPPPPVLPDRPKPDPHGTRWQPPSPLTPLRDPQRRQAGGVTMLTGQAPRGGRETHQE